MTKEERLRVRETLSGTGFSKADFRFEEV